MIIEVIEYNSINYDNYKDCVKIEFIIYLSEKVEN